MGRSGGLINQAASACNTCMNGGAEEPRLGVRVRASENCFDKVLNAAASHTYARSHLSRAKGHLGEWVDGWMGGSMDGWMGGCTTSQIGTVKKRNFKP